MNFMAGGIFCVKSFLLRRHAAVPCRSRHFERSEAESRNLSALDFSATALRAFGRNDNRGTYVPSVEMTMTVISTGAAARPRNGEISPSRSKWQRLSSPSHHSRHAPYTRCKTAAKWPSGPSSVGIEAKEPSPKRHAPCGWSARNASTTCRFSSSRILQVA